MRVHIPFITTTIFSRLGPYRSATLVVLCYRLAMRSAGGLSGPRGLAVPLGTEYEYNDMNGSQYSSRMVARGANPQASARESMEPTGNSDPSANSFISPWCHQSRCEIEGFHQDDDIAQQNPAPHFHGAHYHSTFPTQPSTLPHATHPPTHDRSQRQIRHDYSPNGSAEYLCEIPGLMGALYACNHLASGGVEEVDIVPATCNERSSCMTER